MYFAHCFYTCRFGIDHKDPHEHDQGIPLEFITQDLGFVDGPDDETFPENSYG